MGETTLPNPGNVCMACNPDMVSLTSSEFEQECIFLHDFSYY